MKRIQRLVIVQPSSTTFRSTLLAALLICATLAGTLVGASRLGSSVLANSRAASDEAKTDAPRRAVAVTFMGVPASFGYSDPMVERITGKLILSLNEHRIPAVGFVGASNLFDERNQVKEPRMKLLRMWLDAGLELGNQTYSHPSLYNIPLEQYEQETVRAEEVLNKLLSERGTKVRYFSYPFLNTGPNRETKERFEKFLTERGYTIHPVTIDNMDWLFSKVYAEAKRRDDEATMKRVAAEYVPYMESMFEFYEQLSRDVTGREVPQVLMLSASQLNADYFDEIVAMLQHRGYRFITLDEALKDEAYKQPDTYTGPVGISWLQRWAITRGAEFRTEPYLPPFMQQFDDKRRSGSDFKNKKS